MKVVNCISRISVLDRNWIVCLKSEHYFYVILFSYVLIFFYSLKGETSVFCRKTILVIHYILASYSYAGNYSVGFGTDTIAITAWTTQYPNPNALTQVTITDDGECTPVSQSVYGLSEDGTSKICFFLRFYY